MKLQMIGIDHSMASVEVRERYAFTNAAVRTAIHNMTQPDKDTYGVKGCVLLSTCNRMELFVSLAPEAQPDLYGLICAWKGIVPNEDRALFYKKTDMDAARHLFELTCGLCSQIMGEDQILAQVKDALLLSREEAAADNCIEVLFRQAITVAKEIKSNMIFEKGNRSAATTAIMQLQNEGAVFTGKQALVIGNGMMGRLTAQALMAAGAEVTVTVRQYHSGTVDIPVGVKRMNYGERYDKLPDTDYIFSATASPNLTITSERMADMDLTGKIFVDLAVPRDIDPAVGELPGVRLLGMDDLRMDQMSEEQKQQWYIAQEKITGALADFEHFFYGRDLIPRIRKYADEASEDLWGRMRKDCTGLSDEQRERLKQSVKRCGNKVTAHILYALRDGLDTDTFARCMNILEEK